MNILEFSPSRRGSTLLFALSLILAAVCGVAGWLASHTAVGPTFVFYVVVAAVAFFPLAFLAYRFYALREASYILDDDKLTLTWGLRVEQILISDVEWIRPLKALARPLRMPLVRLPGTIVGARRHPDLGRVEFLASDAKSLLLVATAQRVFAISPADPAAFTDAFRRVIEMGSLVGAPVQSVYQPFVVGRAWRSRLVRFSWLTGLLLNAGLLAWVGATIPTLPRVALGFFPDNTPVEAVPGVYLLLLPILSAAFFAAGWFIGLLFYRRKDQQTLAKIVWLSSVVTSLLFLMAVFFLVTTPV